LTKHFKHNLLPEVAQRTLMRAAQTPITPFNPLARRINVDHAIQQVMRNFPQYFKEIK